MGKSFSGTEIISPSSRYNIGMGHPNSVVLKSPSLANDSLSFFAIFFFSNSLITDSFASSIVSPSRKDELIIEPSPVYASLISVLLMPMGFMT